jgi:GT2 family glycosyltransferase
MNKAISILITVHNRKQKTLRCLKDLYNQNVPSGYEIDVYLIDDGSTDGTAEVVAKHFPKVNIIKGNGYLYWNRGMYTAWETASKRKDYDAYIWLNDDTFIYQNSLSNMILHYEETHERAIIVASVCSAAKEEVTYGGYLKGGKLSPNGTLQECDTMNGNFVLIPKIVFQSIGNLDWSFRHAIGDLDYGYRARKAGFKIFVSRSFLATCELNPQLPKWARKDIPFKERIKNLYSPLGYAEPIPFFKYELRNFGLITAIKHFISIHIRVIFPILWKSH